MQLRPYQKAGLRFLVQRRKAALYWEMRLGKTVTAVKAIQVLNAFPCLIVAPYSALTSWLDEIGEDRVTLLYGERPARLQSLIQGNTDFYWLNTEGHLYLPEISEYFWGSIIIDESTCLKNPKAKISRYFVKQFKDVPVKILLAGIPAPESDLDYVQQLDFLDAMPMNYWKFRNIFCGIAGYDYFVRKKGKEKLANILAEKASFLKLKDVNLGAEKIYRIVDVELNNKHREQYNSIVDDLKISDNRQTIFETTAWIWARRLLGGFLEDKFINENKLIMLNTLLYKQLPPTTGKLIVAFFTNEIYVIAQALKKHSSIGVITGGTKIDERIQLTKDFQAGNLKILICQPEVIKHGLNLSEASEVIFYSSPVSLETRYQCEARATLRKSVFIIDMVTKDTIEEDIIKSLRQKETRAKMIERIVRRIQNAGNVRRPGN